jgi:hypothetical protein
VATRTKFCARRLFYWCGYLSPVQLATTDSTGGARRVENVESITRLATLGAVTRSATPSLLPSNPTLDQAQDDSTKEAHTKRLLFLREDCKRETAPRVSRRTLLQAEINQLGCRDLCRPAVRQSLPVSPAQPLHTSRGVGAASLFFRVDRTVPQRQVAELNVTCCFISPHETFATPSWPRAHRDFELRTCSPACFAASFADEQRGIEAVA